MRPGSKGDPALMLLVLAVAGTAAAQTTGADAETVKPWWGWVFLGRLHPLVVHFPIGLILAGTGFELVQAVRRRPVPSEVGRFCLGVGLVTGAVAVWLGTLNASHQSITGESAAILDWHRYSAWSLLAVAAGALFAGRVMRTRGVGRLGAAYPVLLVGCALLASATGHFGGQLVYGSTYVTSVLPWNRADETPAAARVPAETPQVTSPPPAVDRPVGAAVVPEDHHHAVTAPPPPSAPATAKPAGEVGGSRAAAPAAPAGRELPASPQPPSAGPPPPSGPPPEAGGDVLPQAAPIAGETAAVAPASGRIDFARQVEPILRASCVECHGPEKVKARLRMDSVAGLRAGGKNGALFVPGDPDASLLMRRVLGLDGEDQMPLDNDPLTPEQLDTLRQWILQGARYDARATPDSQPQP